MRSSSALLVAPRSPGAAQDTHLIVITGVGGDEEHAAQFQKWAAAVVDAREEARRRRRQHHVSRRGHREPTRRAIKAPLDAARTSPRRSPTSPTRAKPTTRSSSCSSATAASTASRRVQPARPGPDGRRLRRLLEELRRRSEWSFVNTASSSGAFLEPLRDPAARSSPRPRPAASETRRASPSIFVEALDAERSRPRSQRPRLGAGGVRLRDARRCRPPTRRAATSSPSTPRSTTAAQGKLAATRLSRARSGRRPGRHASVADPALRALLEQRDALERQVAELRLKKELMEPADYDQQLEEAADGSGDQVQGNPGSRRQEMKRALAGHPRGGRCRDARRSGSGVRAPAAFRRPLPASSSRARRRSLRRPLHVRAPGSTSSDRYALF